MTHEEANSIYAACDCIDSLGDDPTSDIAMLTSTGEEHADAFVFIVRNNPITACAVVDTLRRLANPAEQHKQLLKEVVLFAMKNQPSEDCDCPNCIARRNIPNN